MVIIISLVMYLVGCRPWGREELDTTERLPFHFSLSCIGEGNGNPLQCSCLENPRDGGAWWVAVYGVTQSQTRLKWLSSSSSFFFFLVMKTFKIYSLSNFQLFCIVLFTIATMVYHDAPWCFFFPWLLEPHSMPVQLNIQPKTQGNPCADFWASFTVSFPPLQYSAQQISATPQPSRPPACFGFSLQIPTLCDCFESTFR